jgi:hypothetical protein
LSSTGQWAACDEKVFEHDTARSGLIRVVPAKKQVGLWNYSTCVRLEGAQPGPLFYPYLVYSRCHTELVSLDQHVTTFDIISAQVDFLRPLQQGRRFETILVYDSYYGTLLSLQYFREQRIPAIMCLNIQRFREYEALLDRFVQKTGEMAFAERAKDNPGDLDELITLFSSPDHRKGRRYTWTNALRRQNERKAHLILQLMKDCCQVTAPGVLFIAEAIVAPTEVTKYFGEDAIVAKECEIAYNATLMALLWDSVATRNTRLLSQGLKNLPRKLERATWLNYVRCHDDIGFGFDDSDIEQVGFDPREHRRFLIDYFKGDFDSISRGLTFMPNDTTGDARICG